MHRRVHGRSREWPKQSRTFFRITANVHIQLLELRRSLGFNFEKEKNFSKTSPSTKAALKKNKKKNTVKQTVNNSERNSKLAFGCFILIGCYYKKFICIECIDTSLCCVCGCECECECVCVLARACAYTPGIGLWSGQHLKLNTIPAKHLSHTIHSHTHTHTLACLSHTRAHTHTPVRCIPFALSVPLSPCLSHTNT